MRRTISLLLWIALPVMIQGQSAESKLEPSFKTAGAFFALSVADIQASARWYSETLGLKVVMDVPKRDKAAVIVLEGGGLIVELVQLDDAVPLGTAAPSVTAGRQFVHGIFKAGIVVDFDSAVTMLKTRGVAIVAGPFPKRENQRANLLFTDNAGNLLQLFGK